MDDQQYKLQKAILKRIRNVFLSFVVVLVLFLFRIIFFVMWNSNVAAGFEVVRNSILDTVVVRANRGSIYSRNGEPLATSINRKTIMIDFGSERFDDFEKYCKDAKVLAHELSKYFGDKSAKEYYNELIKYRKAAIKQKPTIRVTKPRRWEFWKDPIVDTVITVVERKHITRRIFRDVDINEWNVIRKFPLLNNGLGVTYRADDIEYRVYPQGDISLRTIGRREEHRSYGIEFAMRDTLMGHNGKQLMQTIAPGYQTRVPHRDNIEPQNGYDVITTLDIDVQDVTDSALKEQLVAQNAIWGTTIVMEVATGDILAMANLKRHGSECVEEQNYAIGIPVNPGSTFKLVSAMALLDRGVPVKKMYDSKLGERVKVGGDKGAWVQDSHPISRETKGWIDMRTAFAESANVYFTQAVYDEFCQKPVDFSDFCRKLHFHEAVGLKEFGARSKNLPHLDNRHQSRYNALVNMAYGYGFDITPLHTIAAYNAVANGGKMVAPRLILRTERDGKVVSEAPVKVIEEMVCKKTTVDTLRYLMEQVSLNGTAKEYFSEKACSFRSGSKTGTSQVNTWINNVYYDRKDGYYYGSMVTYFPADNPRYTIMTAIFTKKQAGKSYYGATLAGPVQKRVATFLYNRDNSYAEEVSGATCYSTEIKNGNIEKMRKVTSEYSGKVTAESRRGWGVCERSDDGKSLRISELETAEGRVPNVVGMGLDDALYLLERSGLVVQVVGCGKVVQQSIAANSAIANNKQITITLK